MRQLYSALIIIVFIVVQLAVLPISFILAFTNPGITETEMLDQILPYQAIAFAIGVIVVIAIGHIHKNKNRIERGRQADIPVTIAWIVGGVFLAFIAQWIAAIINIFVLNNPLESANTTDILNTIKSTPLMIFSVALFGPIIEEYVFRRAIFAEIYEKIPGSRIAGFIIAGLLSGIVFAIAHWDFTHIIIYITMAYTFSFLYIISGRLLVPIVVHVFMNSFVIFGNLFLRDFIEQIQNHVSIILNFISIFL